MSLSCVVVSDMHRDDEERKRGTKRERGTERDTERKRKRGEGELHSYLALTLVEDKTRHMWKRDAAHALGLHNLRQSTVTCAGTCYAIPARDAACHHA